VLGALQAAVAGACALRPGWRRQMDRSGMGRDGLHRWLRVLLLQRLPVSATLLSALGMGVVWAGTATLC